MYPTEQDRRRMNITPKQERFALAYCRLANASAAYREVYAPRKMSSKTINEAASRLLKNSKIAARIEEIVAPAAKAARLEVEATLRELARVSFSDARRLFRPDGSLKPIHELDADTAAAVASFEVETGADGVITMKVKMCDKSSALEKAMRHLGLFKRHNSQERPERNVQIAIVGPP